MTGELIKRINEYRARHQYWVGSENKLELSILRTEEEQMQRGDFSAPSIQYIIRQINGH